MPTWNYVWEKGRTEDRAGICNFAEGGRRKEEVGPAVPGESIQYSEPVRSTFVIL